MAGMVKVHLDQARMYRAEPDDRIAVTVGPGDVEVPLWVAQEWGMAPRAPDVIDAVTGEPEPSAAVAGIADYDNLTVAQVKEHLPNLGDEQRAELLAYEQANQARKTLLEMLK